MFLLKQLSLKKLLILFIIFIFLIVNCLNMLTLINNSNNINDKNELKKCNSFEIISKKSSLRTLVENRSLKLSNFMRFPQIFELIPHLRSLNEVTLAPDIVLTNKRKQKHASIVIGISTIKRVNTSYVSGMLDSLLKSIINQEREQILIVLQVAELNDTSFKFKLLKELELKYSAELNSNLIEVIVPPASYYPDFKILSKDETFNDSPERIQWRTKQNYDFSYLMNYCRFRGKYYLQVIINFY